MPGLGRRSPVARRIEQGDEGLQRTEKRSHYNQIIENRLRSGRRHYLDTLVAYRPPMLRHKVYFSIKPLVPLYIRRSVRRWFAGRQRTKVSSVWPIMPGSERPPPGWPGWPNGKKFAFVLTHDVEDQAGLERCRQLMEMDAKWGFRSSFNFVPEGEYRVPKELRDELTGKGFEVGVHDLRHDGKLYFGRQEFAANAARINRYLKEWGAVGFRGGFMLHNLEWLQDLEVQYDASTFDTDPFEPQPDGVGTIFPFWQSDRQGRGYLELPYTLPQDSTLFLLFDERKIGRASC